MATKLFNKWRPGLGERLQEDSGIKKETTNGSNPLVVAAP
jgi:hypothetical protein